MSNTSQYDELFDALAQQTDNSLTVRINVTIDAVRKGMRKALSTAQTMAEIMEEPFPYTSVRVVAVSELERKYRITLLTGDLDPQTNKFKEKFQFEIVEGEPDDTEQT